MAEKIIGKVIHFYDKVPAAVVKLTDNLAVGDRVKFHHFDLESEQVVESMEIEHVKCETAGPGDEVAIRTSSKVHENSTVYKLE